MKTLTTIIISLFTIASSVKANNTNPGASAVLNASVNNGGVVLSWSSVNNKRFEIERSFYSNDFSTVATLQVPFATNNINNFSINDNAAALSGRAIAYYRVKQIAADGTVSYSNTMVVNLTAAATTANKSNTSISFTASRNGNAVITVKSITGQTAATQTIIAGRGNNTVKLNLDGLAKGMYVSEVAVNGVAAASQKIIVE